jgi:hypothetical protein
MGDKVVDRCRLEASFQNNEYEHLQDHLAIGRIFIKL